MTSVTQWTGYEAKLLRAAQRLSLRDFAAHLGVAARTVSNWEKLGKDTVPQPHMQAILDTALDRSSEDAKFRFGLMLHEDQEDDMKRRELLAGISVSLVGDMPVGRLGLSDAKRLQSIADRFNSLDQQFGGDTLWQAAYALTREGLRMLGYCTYNETVGQHLMRAIGRVQMRAGWLAFDAGRHDVARHCYNETLTLARQTNDTMLTTMAFSNLGFQANKLRRPREALRFADAAQSSARGALVEIVPALRKITASGMMGDASGADKAIAVARNVFDRDAGKPTDTWCSFVTLGELDGVEAACQANLGRQQRAVKLLKQAIKNLDDSFTRNRALYQVRLARALLDCDERDGAAEVAKDVQDSLNNGVSSGRVRSGLDAVLSRLGYK